MLVIILSFACLTVVFGENATYPHSNRDILERKTRWVPLVYPRGNPTRLTFITGFGIPVQDLQIETITTGYVLKAQYYLPYTIKQYRTKDTHSITARDNSHNATIFEQLLAKSNERFAQMEPDEEKETTSVVPGYRWAAYSAFETMALRMKLNGRQCVLKSICESAVAPFDHHNGLLGDILHILLTPSSSVDPLSMQSDNDYLNAEQLGRGGGDCNQIYANCPRSLLEHFTDVHHWGSDFLKMLG